MPTAWTRREPVAEQREAPQRDEQRRDRLQQQRVDRLRVVQRQIGDDVVAGGSDQREQRDGDEMAADRRPVAHHMAPRRTAAAPRRRSPSARRSSSPAAPGRRRRARRPCCRPRTASTATAADKGGRAGACGGEWRGASSEWRIASRGKRSRTVIAPIRYSLLAIRVPATRYSLPRRPPPFRRGGAAWKTNWQAFQGVRIGYHAAREQPLGCAKPAVARAEPLPCVAWRHPLIPATFRSMRFI